MLDALTIVENHLVLNVKLFLQNHHHKLFLIIYNTKVHIFQKHILDSLRQAESMRYSQLQPADIESSHFKYHLNQLIKDRLVEHTSRGVYALSTKGKSQVDRLSRRKVNPDLTPKVITYTLPQDSDSYYLLQKDKEPYRGLLNLIGGKMHIGESANEAAIREAREKTELVLEDLQAHGTAEIRIYSKQQLLSHVIAYIFSTDVATDIPSLLTKIGKNSINKQPGLAPDCPKIITAIQKEANPFMLNLDIHL